MADNDLVRCVFFLRGDTPMLEVHSSDHKILCSVMWPKEGPDREAVARIVMLALLSELERVGGSYE